MVNSVPENEENARLCLCPSCPTYKKSDLTNSLFCARGKAKEKVSAANCECPKCQVYKKYSLNEIYYCAQGKSANIKGESSGHCVEMYSGA